MKKVIALLAATLFALSPEISAADGTSASVKCNAYNPIRTEVPQRAKGQTDMLEFAAAPIDTVRIGFIGLGMRGPSAVERFTHIPGTRIVALCDLEPARVDSAQMILRRAGLPDAAGYSGSEDAWKKLCERKDIDLVYIITDWKTHAPMGVYLTLIHL